MVGQMFFVGCRPSADALPVRVVDLVRELDDAELRPPTGFHIAEHIVNGVGRPSVIVPVPSRVTWSLPLPRHGAFRAFVALADSSAGNEAPPVRFRFGVSDNRIYEGLAEITLTAERRGWMNLRTDLSAYAGWQWSLFYRPDRMTWRIVLAADAPSGIPTTAAWGSPEIVTDTRAARQYVARRRQLR
jgi:hypothetical protein